MTDNYSTTAIILAAGSSKRFGENKLLARIKDKTVLNLSIEKFEKAKLVDSIIIVTSKSIKSRIKEIIDQANYTKIRSIIIGGKTRQDSVRIALSFITENGYKCSYVAIHDGARPLVNSNDIDKCIQGSVKYKATALGVRPKDTIKNAENSYSKTIICTMPREALWAIQTPQCFEYDLILNSHLKAHRDNFGTTDDCALVEVMGIKPEVVEGDYKNIKITTPEDLLIATIFYEQTI